MPHWPRQALSRRHITQPQVRRVSREPSGPPGRPGPPGPHRRDCQWHHWHRRAAVQVASSPSPTSQPHSHQHPRCHRGSASDAPFHAQRPGTDAANLAPGLCARPGRPQADSSLPESGTLPRPRPRFARVGDGDAPPGPSPVPWHRGVCRRGALTAAAVTDSELRLPWKGGGCAQRSPSGVAGRCVRV